MIKNSYLKKYSKSRSSRKRFFSKRSLLICKWLKKKIYDKEIRRFSGFFLKEFEVGFRERKSCREKIFLKFCIPFLVSWTMTVAQLIEGEILQSHIRWLREPPVDESCPWLWVVCSWIGESDEMDRVCITEIMHCESSCHFSIHIIGEPLTDLGAIDGDHFSVVSDVVFFEPVFHACREKCLGKYLGCDRLDTRTLWEKFLSRALCSIVPWGEIWWVYALLSFRTEEGISRLLEVICEPESPPTLWDSITGSWVWYPCDKSMSESCHFSNMVNIWFDIDTLILHDTKRITEKSLRPPELRWMIDIEGFESASMQILSVGRRGGTMVVKILWILVFFEACRCHRGSISGIWDNHKVKRNI